MGETTFTWILRDFDVHPYSPDTHLSSPDFSLDASKTMKFSLHLYPNGFKEGEDEGFVSLFLKRQEDEGRNEVKIQYEFCLIDSMGECIIFHKSESSFFKNDLLGHPRFFKRSVVLHKLRHRFLPDNELTVRCRILDLDCIEADSTSEARDENCTSKAHSELSRDFNKLLESQVLSDMTILADGGKFNVHRTILECRCPKLLQGLVQLRDSNAYSLPGIDASLLKTMLTYVYTGVYQDRSILGKVMMAAAINKALSELKPLHSYQSANITAVSGVNIFQVEGKLEIDPLTLMKSSSSDSLVNTECGWLLLCSKEMPDWTWVLGSLLVTEFNPGEFRVTAFKLQQLRKKEGISLNLEIKLVSCESSSKCDVLDAKELEGEDSWVAPLDLDSSSNRKLMSGDLALFVKIRFSSNERRSEIKEIVLNTLFRDEKKSILAEISNFMKDFESLYKSMKNADVILCIGDVKMPAHKIILCSRSEVFLKMFSHNWLEKEKHVVHIEGIDEMTMASLLRFMYCGDIEGPMFSSRAFKLFAVAERYQVFELRDKCRLYLRTVLSIERKLFTRSFIKDIDDAMFADDSFDNSFWQFHSRFIEEDAPKELLLRSEKDFNDIQNGLQNDLDVYSSLDIFFEIAQVFNKIV